jgi:Glycosyltransferase family 87
MNGIAKWSLAALTLACAGWYVYDSFVKQIPTAALSDFRWYYLAADHVLDGDSPYRAEGYIYPPFLAFMLTPLAYLEYVPARWVWFLVSHACLLAAAWLIWRELGADLLAASVVATVWAMGGAAGESLALGQIGPELTLLLAAAYTLKRRGPGECAGTGFALKVIPGILYVIFALRRDFRAIFRAVIVAFVLTVIPWIFVVCCFDGPHAPVHKDYLAGTPSVISWSLPSVALRIYEPFRFGKQMPLDWIIGNGLQTLHLSSGQRLVSLSVAFVTLTLGCGILALRVRGRLVAKQVPLASAAIVALALAASPVCWTHYQIMEYPGVAILLTYAARRRLWRLLGIATLSAAFLYPIPVAVLRAYYERNNNWPNSPAVMYFWTSIPVVATLVVFALMTRELTRGTDEGAPAASPLVGIQ